MAACLLWARDPPLGALTAKALASALQDEAGGGGRHAAVAACQEPSAWKVSAPAPKPLLERLGRRQEGLEWRQLLGFFSGGQTPDKGGGGFFQAAVAVAKARVNVGGWTSKHGLWKTEAPFPRYACPQLR